MSLEWGSAGVFGRPADIFETPVPAANFALIYLHGVGQESLKDKPVYTQLLAELGLNCICPPGDLGWWADRICPSFDPSLTPEQFVLDRVVRWIGGAWGIGPKGIGLFGISMGGQGALRMAFKHPEQFPVVAGISPAIEHYELYGRGQPLDEMYASREQCRQDSAPMHVDPSRQPPHIYFCCDPDDREWHRGSDRLHEKLNALGVAHECDLTTRAGGHTWDYYNHVAAPVLRFLHRGLEQESRRLL